MKSIAIEFVRDPKEQNYVIVSVFKGLYGNLGDLAEFKKGHLMCKRIK